MGKCHRLKKNRLVADDYYNLMVDETEYLVQSRLRALEKVTRDKERIARLYNMKVVPINVGLNRANSHLIKLGFVFIDRLPISLNCGFKFFSLMPVGNPLSCLLQFEPMLFKIHCRRDDVGLIFRNLIMDFFKSALMSRSVELTSSARRAKGWLVISSSSSINCFMSKENISAKT